MPNTIILINLISKGDPSCLQFRHSALVEEIKYRRTPLYIEVCITISGRTHYGLISCVSLLQRFSASDSQVQAKQRNISDWKPYKKRGKTANYFTVYGYRHATGLPCTFFYLDIDLTRFGLRGHFLQPTIPSNSDR